MRQIIMSVFIMCALSVGAAIQPVIKLTCDNSDWERSHIVVDHESFLDKSAPWEGPFRSTDCNRHVIYRFSLADYQIEKIDIKIGNSYRVSMSTDGKKYGVILECKGTVGGLSNNGVKSVDVRKQLKGAREVYLKFEDNNPGDGFGGCLFSIAMYGKQIPHRNPPLFHALPVTSSPSLDGMLDGKDWENAQWIANFNVYGKFKPVTQITRAAALYDSENLYIGVECLDDSMDKVVSMTEKHDGDVYRDNCVEIFISPEVKARYYFHFAVNSIGTKFDEKCESAEKIDINWNPEWSVKTCKSGDRWTAKIAIPFKSLGIVPVPGMVLPLNITRIEGPHSEISSWVSMQGSFHLPSQFGHLVLADNGVSYASYECAPQSLNRNPPQLELLAQRGIAPAEVYADVAMYKASAYGKGAPVATAMVKVAGPGTAVKLFEKVLSPGDYIMNITWMKSAVEHYAQELQINIPNENRVAFAAELIQPYYSNEKSIRVEYRNQTGSIRKASAVVSSAGKELSRQEVAVNGKNGEFTLPLPKNDGKYKVKIVPQPTGGKTVYPPVNLTFEKGPSGSGAEEFCLGPNGVFLKEGKPFLPLVMNLPVDMKELAAAGFNTVVTGFDDAPCQVAENLKLLDDAHNNGIYVWFHLCNLFRNKEDYETLKETVSRFKDHPALAGWYLADEPSGTATSPEVMSKAVTTIKKIDSRHPVIGCDNNPSMFGAYAPLFEVFMPDPYPVPHNGIDTVGTWLKSSAAFLKPTQSLGVILQAQGKPFYPRGPNRIEIRNMAFQSMIAGVKSMAWWAHGPARDSKEWSEYPILLKQIKTLEPYLLQNERKEFTANGCKTATFRGAAGTAVLAVNLGNAPATIEIPVNLNSFESVVDENVEVVADGDKTQIKLPALGSAAWIK